MEINELKKEVSNYKHILKSYEDQNLKISDLEKKLRIINIKNEKDNKSIENIYDEKIRSLNQKISFLEEKLKLNHNQSYKSLIRKQDDTLKTEKYESSVNQN